MKETQKVFGNSKDTFHAEKDKVYIRTNVKDEGEGFFSYDETVYEKDEYLKLMAENITDIQLALCELYESAEVL